MISTALTIAGSDPSGGAGIQADLKTFHQRKVYGMAVVALLTVQNTCGIRNVYFMNPAQVTKQLEAVLADIPPRAVKTGALGSAGNIRAVARCLRKLSCPLVVDPVMVSKHGATLMKKEAIQVFKKELLPLATLVTPNLHESGLLSGIRVYDLSSMEKAAKLIAKFGSQAVLIKGGHLRGAAADLLYARGRVKIFKASRIRTRHTHGTGCTFSAAITAELAKGKTVADAILIAKKFITQAILTSPHLGRGMGPVNHHAGT